MIAYRLMRPPTRQHRQLTSCRVFLLLLLLLSVAYTYIASTQCACVCVYCAHSAVDNMEWLPYDIRYLRRIHVIVDSNGLNRRPQIFSLASIAAHNTNSSDDRAITMVVCSTFAMVVMVEEEVAECSHTHPTGRVSSWVSKNMTHVCVFSLMAACAIVLRRPIHIFISLLTTPSDVGSNNIIKKNSNVCVTPVVLEEWSQANCENKNWVCLCIGV